MCRNIVPLFNFDPTATAVEVRDAAHQYVRKVSGMQKPAQVNQAAFDAAVAEIAAATQKLLDELTTKQPPRNRETEAAKARARTASRYAGGSG